jgi:hypothetical protein
VRVVFVPEFIACRERVVKTRKDSETLTSILDRLADEHQTAAMRRARLVIPGTGIEPWATETFPLGRDLYRITWRYQDDDDESTIVCFTLAHIR